MTRRLLFGALLAALTLSACNSRKALDLDAERRDLTLLEKERDTLRTRLDELMPRDKRLKGMPKSAVRIGLPTGLTRTLIERVLSGVVDQVEIQLMGIRIHKSGTVKKMVTLGNYELDVELEEVRASLAAGAPTLKFGGNRVSIALPVRVAKGTGRTNLAFKWDGRNVGGMVCGDMDINRKLTGEVRPDTYPISGTLLFERTAAQMLVRPRFPRLVLKIQPVPTAESWAQVEAMVAEKTGMCGFVLKKVDILQVVKDLLSKGFDVSLPTEKIKPVAVPVGIAPSLVIHGQRVNLAARVEALAITEHMIWLGADITLMDAPNKKD